MGWNVQLPDAEWYDRTSPELGTLIKTVMAMKEVAIDTETTGLVVWKDRPLFWSLSFDDGMRIRRICMPADTLYLFTAAFNDTQKRWIFANAKFDLHMIANYGIQIHGVIVDIQVMHALIYEEQSHALKDMAKQILGWKWADFGDTFKFGGGGKLTQYSTASDVMLGGRFQTVQDAILWCYHNDRTKLVEYAANDAYGTLMLYYALKKELAKSPAFSLYNSRFSGWSTRPNRVRLAIDNQLDLFEQVEVPFTKVLWTCERNGIMVNTQYIGAAAEVVKKEIDELEREANRINGKIINLNSPDQLADYFFERQKLRPLKYTKGGKKGIRKPSCDKAFLEYYEADDPLAAVAVKHRDLSKLYGTYLMGLPTHMDMNGRIHTRFNQDVARTGRLSSADPNMQNIPNPERDKYKIRRAFIAPDGWRIICFDYDQLEMRLLGAASMQQSMIDIFRSGKDIHMGNAELVFGHPYDDIKRAKKMKDDEWATLTNAQVEYFKKCLHSRSAVKTVGFGLNYGMKEKQLAKKIGCSVDVAVDIINRYMAALPAVKQFYAEAIEECRKTGYSFTLLGRRRFLPEINARSDYDRFKAERQAVNNQIQGTAADAAKLAMINCHAANLDDEYACRMLLQIHDELVFECPDETAKEASARIHELMEDPFPSDLAVAITVSGGIGSSWEEAKG